MKPLLCFAVLVLTSARFGVAEEKKTAEAGDYKSHDVLESKSSHVLELHPAFQQLGAAQKTDAKNGYAPVFNKASGQHVIDLLNLEEFSDSGGKPVKVLDDYAKKESSGGDFKTQGYKVVSLQEGNGQQGKGAQKPKYTSEGYKTVSLEEPIPKFDGEYYKGIKNLGLDEHKNINLDGHNIGHNSELGEHKLDLGGHNLGFSEHNNGHNLGLNELNGHNLGLGEFSGHNFGFNGLNTHNSDLNYEQHNLGIDEHNLGDQTLSLEHNLGEQTLNHGHKLGGQTLDHGHNFGEQTLSYGHNLKGQTLSLEHNLGGQTLSHGYNSGEQTLSHGHNLDHSLHSSINDYNFAAGNQNGFNYGSEAHTNSGFYNDYGNNKFNPDFGNGASIANFAKGSSSSDQNKGTTVKQANTKHTSINLEHIGKPVMDKPTYGGTVDNLKVSKLPHVVKLETTDNEKQQLGNVGDEKSQWEKLKSESYSKWGKPEVIPLENWKSSPQIEAKPQWGSLKSVPPSQWGILKGESLSQWGSLKGESNSQWGSSKGEDSKWQQPQLGSLKEEPQWKPQWAKPQLGSLKEEPVLKSQWEKLKGENIYKPQAGKQKPQWEAHIGEIKASKPSGASVSVFKFDDKTKTYISSTKLNFGEIAPEAKNPYPKRPVVEKGVPILKYEITHKKPSTEDELLQQAVDSGAAIIKHVPIAYAEYIDKPHPLKIYVEKPVLRQKIVKIPYKVEIPKPVILEKKVPYPVKVFEQVAKPYPVYKDVPVPKLVYVDKPVPKYVEKPYPVKVIKSKNSETGKDPHEEKPLTWEEFKAVKEKAEEIFPDYYKSQDKKSENQENKDEHVKGNDKSISEIETINSEKLQEEAWKSYQKEWNSKTGEIPKAEEWKGYDKEWKALDKSSAVSGSEGNEEKKSLESKDGIQDLEKWKAYNKEWEPLERSSVDSKPDEWASYRNGRKLQDKSAKSAEDLNKWDEWKNAANENAWDLNEKGPENKEGNDTKETVLGANEWKVYGEEKSENKAKKSGVSEEWGSSSSTKTLEEAKAYNKVEWGSLNPAKTLEEAKAYNKVEWGSLNPVKTLEEAKVNKVEWASLNPAKNLEEAKAYKKVEWASLNPAKTLEEAKAYKKVKWASLNPAKTLEEGNVYNKAESSQEWNDKKDSYKPSEEWKTYSKLLKATEDFKGNEEWSKVIDKPVAEALKSIGFKNEGRESWKPAGNHGSSLKEWSASTDSTDNLKYDEKNGFKQDENSFKYEGKFSAGSPKFSAQIEKALSYDQKAQDLDSLKYATQNQNTFDSSKLQAQYKQSLQEYDFDKQSELAQPETTNNWASKNNWRSSEEEKQNILESSAYHYPGFTPQTGGAKNGKWSQRIQEVLETKTEPSFEGRDYSNHESAHYPDLGGTHDFKPSEALAGFSGFKGNLHPDKSFETQSLSLQSSESHDALHQSKPSEGFSWHPSGSASYPSKSSESLVSSLGNQLLHSSHSLGSEALHSGHSLGSQLLSSGHSLGSKSLPSRHSLESQSLLSSHSLGSQSLHSSHSFGSQLLHSTHSLGSESLHSGHSLGSQLLDSSHSLGSKSLPSSHSLGSQLLHSGHSLGSESTYSSHSLGSKSLPSSHSLGSEPSESSHSLGSQLLHSSHSSHSLGSQLLDSSHSLGSESTYSSHALGSQSLPSSHSSVSQLSDSSHSLGSQSLHSSNSLGNQLHHQDSLELHKNKFSGSLSKPLESATFNLGSLNLRSGKSLQDFTQSSNSDEPHFQFPSWGENKGHGKSEFKASKPLKDIYSGASYQPYESSYNFDNTKYNQFEKGDENQAAKFHQFDNSKYNKFENSPERNDFVKSPLLSFTPSEGKDYTGAYSQRSENILSTKLPSKSNADLLKSLDTETSASEHITTKKQLFPVSTEESKTESGFKPIVKSTRKPKTKESTTTPVSGLLKTEPKRATTTQASLITMESGFVPIK